MSEVIKYCRQCAITGDNLKESPNPRNIEYGKGYLASWGDVKECPYCHSNVETINMSTDDYLVIRDASNYNRQLLEAMIDLKQKDIIEYELKMSQFRAQAEQRKIIQNQQHEDNIPKCPTCGSTNIERISMSKKIKGGFLFGVFSSDVRNTMHCKSCGAKW